MASVDGSLSLHGASDEVHTTVCGPCKTDNVERGAGLYCEDCSEYLCDQCKDYHRKLPLTKNHRIVPGSQVPVVTSTRGRPSIVVYCRCNKNQEVQYFCDDHEDVVCDTCKNTKHYKCKVSATQDKSSSYTQSRLNSIMSKLKALKDDYAQLKKVRNDESKFGALEEDCKKEIHAFRKEFDAFLDNLEKSMLMLLESYKTEEQKRISQHISTLTATLKMLESDYTLLEDAKYDGRKELMFATDVQVSKGLQDNEDRVLDIENDSININIKFEKNKKLDNLQHEIDSLGSLNRSSTRNIKKDRRELLGSKIQSQKQVNVKLPDNYFTTLITGCVVMSGGDIVVCDRGSNTIKLLDSSDVLKHSLKLNKWPWDVSVVDAKTVIVTLPGAKGLQYIEVFPQLKAGRVLQLNKQYWGVRVAGDKIFTSCHNDRGEGEVRILDLDGNIHRRLGINQDGSFLFKWPTYITVNPSEEKIFVSDLDKDNITCITVDNRVIYQYSDDEMKRPRGLYCDSGDNILVCGDNSNNVQVITAEGKKKCNLLSRSDGLNRPYCIGYRESDDTLIVGCYGSDNVFLFKLRK